MAEPEGVSYCLYPELKENKNRSNHQTVSHLADRAWLESTAGVVDDACLLDYLSDL